MKFVLIRPPVLTPTYNMAELVVPPIGPAYVAAAIRQAGHTVELMDAVGLAIDQYTPYEGGTLLHGLTFDQVVQRIPPTVDAIGISANFSYDWPICRELLKKIRTQFPRVLLIGGGEHATAAPEFSLKESALDVIVMGEAEHTTCELLKRFESQGAAGLKDLPGIAYKDASGEIHRNAAAPRISDLKSIPWPAWDLLPMEEYLSRGHGFGVSRGRSMPILASRGCPYQCTFCSNPSMWTVRWKARDPNDVLDEIVFLQKQYQATNFDFYDLTMIVKKEWIVDFCHAIEARKMNFTWQLPSGTRSEAIDEEVTNLLYRTGCRNLSYAPESGSEETLTLIKKRVAIPKLMTSMRTAVKEHLNVKCNFIFGFPKDRWKNIIETCWAIIQSAVVGIHDIAIWVFVPYPGSELFRQLQAEGKIQRMDDTYFLNLAAYGDITKTFSYCEALTKQQLLWARIFGTILFYATSWLIRPWRPLRSVYNLISGRIESRSEHALRTSFKRSVTVMTDFFGRKHAA